MNFPPKLNRNFYTSPLLQIAPALLGKILVKKSGKAFLAGKIVEVEAYDGATDESAHTFNGKTKRNEVMFKEGGYLYVYLSYGVHFCCNIVTGNKDHGTAVLIRAIEPLTGLDSMALNRYGRSEYSEKDKMNLTNGPGKLCKALNLIKKDNGTDLLKDEIFLTEANPPENFEIVQTTRIGISKAKDLPWRFYIKDNPYVSRK